MYVSMMGFNKRVGLNIKKSWKNPYSNKRNGTKLSFNQYMSFVCCYEFETIVSFESIVEIFFFFLGFLIFLYIRLKTKENNMRCDCRC